MERRCKQNIFSEDEIFGNSKQESSDERPLIN